MGLGKVAGCHILALGSGFGVIGFRVSIMFIGFGGVIFTVLNIKEPQGNEYWYVVPCLPKKGAVRNHVCEYSGSYISFIIL